MNIINPRTNNLHMRHTLSSAPKSLNDIQNIEDSSEDDDDRSVQTYRTNISEITNQSLRPYQNMQQNKQIIQNQNNMIMRPQNIQQQNHLQQMEAIYEREMNAGSMRFQQNNNDVSLTHLSKQSVMKDELIPRKNNNFRFVDQTQIELYQQQMNEEDEDDELTEILDESNPEFVDFKTNVRDWLKLDDDIKTLQRAIAERRKKKNELTPKVLEFMGKYEIEDLNTHEGKVQYAKSMITKPMNKDYIKQRLTEYLKSMDKAEKCTKYLMENRLKEERVRLKRVNPRKKKE